MRRMTPAGRRMAQVGLTPFNLQQLKQNPYEWPPWQIVYHYVRKWRLDGTWMGPGNGRI